MNTLQEAKAVLQKIIDKYLPEKEKFSVQEMNEEQVNFLVEFFLERDEIERDKIWARIESEIEESKSTISETMNEVKKIKELLDQEKLDKTDLNDLMNLVKTENSFEQGLNELDF